MRKRNLDASQLNYYNKKNWFTEVEENVCKNI